MTAPTPDPRTLSDDEGEPLGPLTQISRDIAEVINRHSREGASNTPDFVLAGFLVRVLRAFEAATKNRERFASRGPEPTEAVRVVFTKNRVGLRSDAAGVTLFVGDREVWCHEWYTSEPTNSIERVLRELADDLTDQLAALALGRRAGPVTRGPTDAELDALMQGRIPYLRHAHPDVPAQWRDIIRTALARYSDPDAVRRAREEGQRIAEEAFEREAPKRLREAAAAGARGVRDALFEYSGAVTFDAIRDHLNAHIARNHPAPPAAPPSVTRTDVSGPMYTVPRDEVAELREGLRELAMLVGDVFDAFEDGELASAKRERIAALSSRLAATVTRGAE